MAGKLLAELRQNRPFRSTEEEAVLNIQRTADVLARRFVELIDQYDLTITQYNVLRILRGAGETGLACKEIGARLVQRDPDVTRLLDRLEKRRLITRSRSEMDRRALKIAISEEGLRVLDELDEPVQNLHHECLGHLGSERLTHLIDSLEAIRAQCG